MPRRFASKKQKYRRRRYFFPPSKHREIQMACRSASTIQSRRHETYQNELLQTIVSFSHGPAYLTCCTCGKSRHFALVKRHDEGEVNS